MSYTVTIRKLHDGKDTDRSIKQKRERLGSLKNDTIE